jgi:hypothetical protein
MSEQYRPGDTYHGGAAFNDTTGAAANPTSGPSGKVVHNGAIDLTPVVTLTNLEAGAYDASVIIPAGYAVGDSVYLLIQATIGTVVTKQTTRAVRLVGWGPTALPNAAAGAPGGAAIVGSAMTLASNGLDAISMSESASGPPSNFREWLLWLIRRFAQATRTIAGQSGSIAVKKASGAGWTTQAITDDGMGNETQGPPT